MRAGCLYAEFMLSTVNRWFDDNRWAGDAVLAGIVLVLLEFASVTSFGYHGGSSFLTFLLVLPLFARRSFPLAVLLVTAALCVIQLVWVPDPVAGDLVVPLVIHAAAAYIPDKRWGIAGLVAGLGGAVIAAVQWSGFYYQREPAQLLTIFLAGVAVVVAAYLLGLRHRERREHATEQLSALAERNRLLTTERDTRVEVGAAAERARIARELHDIVAHSLSVIVVQADGGAAAARRQPELGPQVLDTIASASRDALAQMRRMVSVLRTGDASPGYAPTPCPNDLDDLVAQVRAAGLPIEFDTIGTVRDMASDGGLAAYRAVQESLTNVLKHAGPAAQCRVVLHYGPSEVVITVSDDGRGAAGGFENVDGSGDGAVAAGLLRRDVPGQGLVGMRERVELQGGSVHAGPKVGGGFEVAVTVPYGRVEAETGSATSNSGG